ncbi:MAG TPA: hypothetical protein VLH35_06295 [Candidatus Acidoferrales bacterium]|nr:hypothetical protein [Candidatus Acidoferrales bacterium]
MVSTSVIVVIVAASILSPTAFIVFDNAQTQMTELNTQFTGIMNETTGFLDNAWNVAQEFQNPDYRYNPSELSNYTNTESSAFDSK